MVATAPNAMLKIVGPDRVGWRQRRKWRRRACGDGQTAVELHDE